MAHGKKHMLIEYASEWMNGDQISCDAGTAAVWAEFHVHDHACLRA